ncbi:glycine betaine/L-proline ABC transporter substrate-binding protein ProX [Vibrio cionasavignyae]|uniref:glycine betaine/L-proline ABC transporter substrate-binding protein ProX n=1 Tax=Vibrio cionasavignyae TaxID=2910252 RepID=UPI003D0BFFB3
MKVTRIMLLAKLFITLTFSALLPAAPQPTLQPIQSDISEESFQTMLVIESLKQLGYEIAPTKTMSYDEAYLYVSAHPEAFFAAGWLPLHQDKYRAANASKSLYLGGNYVPRSAQGYMIDKKTALKYDITHIDQLKDPQIAKLFDHTDDGIADLVGCKEGWGCAEVINHQIERFGIIKTVSHHQGDYDTLMAETIQRYQDGKPILYYTWTPNWVANALIPNEDTVWLEVPFSALPGSRQKIDTTLPHGRNFGFEVNTQHIVANKSLVLHNADIHRLFEVMRLATSDISKENWHQNNSNTDGYSAAEYTKKWIEENKPTFSAWIEEAKNAKEVKK